MTITRARLLEIIYASIDELNAQFGHTIEKTPEQPLLGREGALDSLGFVNFVSSIEQRLQDEIGVQLVMADEITTSKHSPSFRTVAELADCLATRLQAAS